MAGKSVCRTRFICRRIWCATKVLGVPVDIELLNSRVDIENGIDPLITTALEVLRTKECCTMIDLAQEVLNPMHGSAWICSSPTYQAAKFERITRNPRTAVRGSFKSYLQTTTLRI